MIRGPFFLAQMSQPLAENQHFELANPAPEIQARAVLLISTNLKNQEKVILEMNGKEKLAIASLTKLMNALVAVKNYDLEQPVVISKEAVNQEENFGLLNPGETLSVKNLLYLALIESSNDAAFALAELKGEEEFVVLMNSEAEELGLINTKFFNSSGLDPNEPEGNYNYSTAEDLAKLMKYLIANQPTIMEIISLSEYDLFRPDGSYHHHLVNSNKLIGKIPGIIGGKTGWSPLAKGNLILIVQKDDNYLINIILGSDNNRFEEMEKLINWADNLLLW